MAGFNKGTKGSLGHAIASDVMTKDNYAPKQAPEPDSTSKSSAKKFPFHSLSIDGADNGGVTVTHYPHDTKNGGQDYAKKHTAVFESPIDAHRHIGKLMDCPDCAGSGGK